MKPEEIDLLYKDIKIALSHVRPYWGDLPEKCPYNSIESLLGHYMSGNSELISKGYFTYLPDRTQRLFNEIWNAQLEAAKKIIKTFDYK